MSFYLFNQERNQLLLNMGFDYRVKYNALSLHQKNDRKRFQGSDLQSVCTVELCSFLPAEDLSLNILKLLRLPISCYVHLSKVVPTLPLTDSVPQGFLLYCVI